MLAFVLPSFIACQFTARPGLVSIERHNAQIRDLEHRTRKMYKFVMLNIAEWAQMPETESEMGMPVELLYTVCRTAWEG
jgi:hypothetical protein